MPLNSTLFTGLSGLNVNQTSLNVVGNNIANANTTAFKSSRALFKPQFYVTTSPGTPADNTFGGTNPDQIGLGAQVGSIGRDFSEGSIQPTGKNTDMAIDGAGFFVVQNGQQGQTYTRDGTFSLNDQNKLVNASGSYVQGYSVDPNFNIVSGNLAQIQIPLGNETIAKATGNATLMGNLNSGGQAATGASQLTTQALQGAGGAAVTAATPLTTLQPFAGTTNLYTPGETITMAGLKGTRTLPSQTFTVTPTSTVADLQNFFQTGLGIDIAPPAGSPGPTPGLSLVNAASGGQQLVITGNIGTENSLSLAGAALTTSAGASPLTFTDAGGANGESTHTTVNAFDSLGTPITVNVTAVLASKSDAGSTWNFYATSPDNNGGTPVMGNGTLKFDTSGRLVNQSGNTLLVNRSGTGANPMQSIKLDFTGIQSLADTSSGLVSPNQDGFKIGTLNNFSVGSDGVITGSFTNGLTRTIGQVAVATFANPQGLQDKGGNQFGAGPDSGAAQVSAPGTLGAGQIRAGALESSNVDLSKEFINLIISSTGFSASSRVISTSNQLLTDLLNSSR